MHPDGRRGCTVLPSLQEGAYVPAAHPRSADVLHGEQSGGAVSMEHLAHGTRGRCSHGSQDNREGSHPRTIRGGEVLVLERAPRHQGISSSGVTMTSVPSSSVWYPLRHWTRHIPSSVGARIARALSMLNGSGQGAQGGSNAQCRAPGASVE